MNPRFNSLFNNKTALEVVPYFLKWGTRSNIEGNKLKPIDKEYYEIYEETDNLKLSINLKKLGVTGSSELILAVRLKLNEGMYFPYNNRDCEAVYLAVKVALSKGWSDFDKSFNENPKFMIKDKLLKTKSWS